MVAIKSEFVFHPVNVSSLTDTFPLIDVIGCSIKFDYVKCVMYVVYIPPDVSAVDFKQLLVLFEEISVSSNAGIIVLGDFNVTHFRDNSLTDSKSRAVLNLSSFSDIKQVNNVVNNRARLLDLVLTNYGDNLTIDSAFSE